MKVSKRSMRVLSLLVISVVALVGLSSCNLYGGIDSPSGDTQVLSAARSAFDQGNYSQALKLYQQLSSSSKDVQLSEEADVVFNQAGGNIANFAAAFGNGKNINIGSAIATFATAMVPYVGATNRTAVFNAFLTYKSITPGSDLASLTEFLGSMTMAGLVLAEDIPASDNAYHVADVCPPAGVPLAGACSPGILGAGTISGTNMGTSVVGDFNTASANLSMFNGAMLNVTDAITVMGASGNFGSGFQTLVTALQNSAPAGNGGIYRAEMIAAGIGL